MFALLLLRSKIAYFPPKAIDLLLSAMRPPRQITGIRQREYPVSNYGARRNYGPDIVTPRHWGPKKRYNRYRGILEIQKRRKLVYHGAIENCDTARLDLNI